METYLIKNSDYEDKKVLANDIYEAIDKYHIYVDNAISIDYSVYTLYLGDYVQENYIII